MVIQPRQCGYVFLLFLIIPPGCLHPLVCSVGLDSPRVGVRRVLAWSTVVPLLCQLARNTLHV